MYVCMCVCLSVFVCVCTYVCVVYLIAELWYDMYLASRLPLLLHYNPFMMFSDPKPAHSDQVRL